MTFGTISSGHNLHLMLAIRGEAPPAISHTGGASIQQQRKPQSFSVSGACAILCHPEIVVCEQNVLTKALARNNADAMASAAEAMDEQQVTAMSRV